MSIVFPEYRQLDLMDCGPACLKMISQYYGKNYSLQRLRERCFISRQGVSMLGISDAAESIGFRTRGVKLTLQELIDNKPYPCIIHWNQNHFVVCYGSSKHGRFFKISDPARGKYEIDRTGFEKCWLSMQEMVSLKVMHCCSNLLRHFMNKKRIEHNQAVTWYFILDILNHTDHRFFSYF